MPRPRKDEETQDNPQEESVDPGSEAQATLTLRGPASRVRRELESGPAPEAAESETKEPPSRSDAFAAALQNPNYVVVVKRVRPRTVKDGQGGKIDVNVEVLRDQCPLDLASIEEELAQNHGGRRYVVRILDPESNKAMAHTFLEVPGDPIIQSAGVQGDIDLSGVGTLGAEPPTAAEVLQKTLAEQTSHMQQRISLAQLKQQLSEIEDQAGVGPDRAGDGVVTPNPLIAQQIQTMQRQISDKEAADRIERIQETHRRDMTAMQTRLEEAARPKSDPLASIAPILQAALTQKQIDPMATLQPIMQLIMSQMDQSNKRFELMMSQLQNNQVAQLAGKIDDLRKSPSQKEGSTILETVEIIKQLKHLADNDLEDDDDEDDDKPKDVWEILVGEHLPKVIKLFEDRAFGGRPVTGPEAKAELDKAIKAAEDEAVTRSLAQIRAAQAAPQGAPQPLAAPAPAGPQSNAQILATQPNPFSPPPVAVAPPPAPRPAPPPVAVAPQQVAPPPAPVVPPPAPPAPVAVAPPQVVAPPAAPTPADLTVEQQIQLRSAQVLMLISNEVDMRPREYQWNDAAWHVLPEPILEKICAAPDPVTMLDAFTGQVNQQALQDLKTKVGVNPRNVAWLKVGHDFLREAWPKNMADPAYDPFDDDGDEEEA